MATESEASAPPHGPYLEHLARERGDPELFPPEVVQLHSQGQARRARVLLRKHARRTERDVARAARQLGVVDEPRFWLEPISGAPPLGRFNGIGTALLGRYRQADDGTYVATHWFTLVFLPLWPLAAYLVFPEGDGWRVLARTPVPPFAHTVRRVVGAAAVAAAAVAVWSVYWAGAHTDLYVYNGFDRAVVAHVGTARNTVYPRSHAIFEDLSLSTVSVGAAWDDELAPFESLTVDLAGHGRHIVIYNVADRAVLGIGYIVYGEREPREARWLDRGPIVIVQDKVHYPFTKPPDSLRVDEGGSLEKTVLGAVDAEIDVGTVLLELVRQDRMDQALAVARAELMVHPENAMLARYAAGALLGDDFAAQVELLRWCLQRVPDSVDVHRAYQDLWREDRDSVRAEYASLLASNPRSPMYHYLAGRLEPLRSAEAVRRYRAALELDPGYAPAFRALSYHATMSGRWAEAVDHLDRFASLGTEQALEAVEERIRLRRLLGRDARESIRVVDEAAELSSEPLYLDVLRSHLRLEREPTRLGEECDAITRKARALEVADVVALNLCADLAVTAGDLAKARGLLTQADPRQQRSEVPTLRLALSDGAAPEDRALLTGIPNWDKGRHLLLLPALEFLDPSERDRVLAGWGNPDLEAVARLLEAPAELAQPERLDQVLAESSLMVRAVAYLAAARRLADETGPVGIRARQRYLSRARSMALPGELPYLRR